MARPRSKPSARRSNRHRWRLAVGALALLLAVAVILARNPGVRASTTKDSLEPTSSIPYSEVPRISLAEAKARLDAGTALFLDVRSQSAYDQGHIASAISLPLDELESRYQELPRDKEIITICT